MTNDQPFGWRMNAVAGPVLASAALIHPKAYATDQQAHANTVAIRNPPSSRVSAGASSLGRGLASAKQIDEMGANSGPTTIAPTMSMGWSRYRPMPAMSVASTKNETNDQDIWTPSRALASIDSQMTASAGLPGAAFSAASAASDIKTSASSKAIDPVWWMPSRLSS